MSKWIYCKHIGIAVMFFCSLKSFGQDASFIPPKDEILYLIGKYKDITPDYLRGVDSSVWNRKVERLLEKIDSSKSRMEYIYALRFFSSLLNDRHAAPGGAFPSQGFYNRNKFTNENDIIFPVTVKVFRDGRTFVVKDYSGNIPSDSELLKVNGLSVIGISLLLEDLYHAEKHYSLPELNYLEQPDVRAWCILPTHLFMEGINEPFEVEYCLFGDSVVNHVVLPGMFRADIFREFKKSGDKRKIRKMSAFSKIPIEYVTINDSIALLDINVFLGRNSLSVPFVNFNSRYKRLLRRAMKSIDNYNYKHLIIDVRANPGGYLGNILNTLDYLTTDTIRKYAWFKVSSESKEMAAPVLRDTYKLIYGNDKREEQNESIRIFQNMPEGSLFRADTLLPLLYVPPHKLKHRYQGEVYVLSDALSYSASILFCTWIQQNKTGMLVGESPGGFINVRGGMTAQVKLQGFNYQYMNVPYSVSSCFPDLEAGNNYLTMDYEIIPSFDEWFGSEDVVLKRLITWIVEGR